MEKGIIRAGGCGLFSFLCSENCESGLGLRLRCEQCTPIENGKNSEKVKIVWDCGWGS